MLLPHLQRMLLRLQRYIYTIVYKPSKEIVLADRLSRFPSRKDYLPIELHQDIQHVNFTPDRVNIIRGATERDPIYNTIYCTILSGWPEHIHKVSHITHHCWDTRDELTVKNGILLKDNRICIPPELYDRTLSDLHQGHTGIEKMQHLMRDTVYWPNMDADIAKYIKRCNICTKFKAAQVMQLMLQRDILEGPLQDLAANFFKHDNTEYLIIADTSSKYPFIFKITSKTIDRIIEKFKQLISQYGPPN